MAVAVTDLLRQWQGGDGRAFDALMPAVYGELRRMARNQMRGERGNHTLQPTALVHEACLRLADHHRMHWRDRAHFLALSAILMRRILVSHARRHQAAKRGGGRKVTLSDELAGGGGVDVELLALSAALERLERLDPRQARVVELRYFGGLTIEETAAALAVCPATVKVDWNLARAWLLRELGG